MTDQNTIEIYDVPRGYQWMDATGRVQPTVKDAVIDCLGYMADPDSVTHYRNKRKLSIPDAWRRLTR